MAINLRGGIHHSVVMRVETEGREEGHKEGLGIESVGVMKVGAEMVFKDSTLSTSSSVKTMSVSAAAMTM